VLDRFIAYQKLSLSVKKKVLVSLIYPALLLTLGLRAGGVPDHYVVPNFAQLYSSMQAKLPQMTLI